MTRLQLVARISPQLESVAVDTSLLWTGSKNSAIRDPLFRQKLKVATGQESSDTVRCMVTGFEAGNKKVIAAPYCSS